MSLRISSLVALLLIAACGSKEAVEDKVVTAEAADRIDCAIDGASDFSKSCAIERAGDALIIRHEGGGFRKLTLTADGTIDTADGAEAITIQSLSDGRTEVRVARDRYRLPPGL